MGVRLLLLVLKCVIIGVYFGFWIEKIKEKEEFKEVCFMICFV